VKTTFKPGEIRGGEVMFWLVRHVDQKPDPSVLPAGPLMQATAIEAMNRRIARIGEPGGAS
jgi:hypothetical protein